MSDDPSLLHLLDEDRRESTALEIEAHQYLSRLTVGSSTQSGPSHYCGDDREESVARSIEFDWNSRDPLLCLLDRGFALQLGQLLRSRLDCLSQRLSLAEPLCRLQQQLGYGGFVDLAHDENPFRSEFDCVFILSNEINVE